MRRTLVLLCVVACACAGVLVVRSTNGDEIADRARKVHFSSMVLDTHDDATQRLLLSKTFDLGKRNPDGHVDIPPMREGGLNAISSSVWVAGRTPGPPASQ